MNTEDFWSAFRLWTVGFTLTANLLAAWFFSNFPQHLWNLVHRHDTVFTKDDLTTAAVGRYGSWGDLWVCPICLGTWISLLVATGLGVLTDVSLVHGLRFAAFSALSWPLYFYLLYGVLKRI